MQAYESAGLRKNPHLKVFALLLAGVVAASLAAGRGHCQSVSAAVPSPVIKSFAASPPLVMPGQSATLAWAVTGATKLIISGVGTVTGTSINVRPQRSMVYTLKAVNARG